jgi:hypothetical protein
LYSSIRWDFTGRSGVVATAVRTGRAMVPPPISRAIDAASSAVARRDHR